MLRPVEVHPASRHSQLIMGAGDDAGVYALGDGRALVQTVDIFTPVVDSPYDWGRIAAANALSDIYAMGAVPLTALQYLAWPREVLPLDLAGEVITGGLDIMASAGCTIVGGHSIDGPEPTYGFAVTGLAGSDSVVKNSGADPGDALVLTKPLGMGIITTGIKRDATPEPVAADAIEVMVELNDRAAQVAVANGVHAMTDVSGFGLLGHLREVCEASGVGAEVWFESVPVLEGTAELLAAGMWPGGSQRNLHSIESIVESSVGHDEVRILADAQTSGGLLIALPAESVDAYRAEIPRSRQIGVFVTGRNIAVLP